MKKPTNNELLIVSRYLYCAQLSCEAEIRHFKANNHHKRMFAKEHKAMLKENQKAYKRIVETLRNMRLENE